MGEWYDERSPEDLKNMALNIHNMKQVLIPFSTFLLWGWYKEILLWTSLLFLGIFLPKKKKAQMLRISSDGFIFVVSIWTGLSRLSDRWVGEIWCFVSLRTIETSWVLPVSLLLVTGIQYFENAEFKSDGEEDALGVGDGRGVVVCGQSSRFVPVLEFGGEFC